MDRYRRNDQSGSISLPELLIIMVLVLEGIFLAYKGISWFYDEMSGGNDRFLVNTAESTALAESLNGTMCPVYNCQHGNLCTHRQGGYYVGYFEETTHHIVSYRPKGYNQNSVMRIGRTRYYGDPETMVIQVKCRDGEIVLNWVRGRQ